MKLLAVTALLTLLGTAGPTATAAVGAAVAAEFAAQAPERLSAYIRIDTTNPLRTGLYSIYSMAFLMRDN